MRALENNMKIDVPFTDSDPLSVDTQDDLEERLKTLWRKRMSKTKSGFSR